MKDPAKETKTPPALTPATPRVRRSAEEIRADAELRLAKMDLRDAQARADEAEERLIEGVRIRSAFDSSDQDIANDEDDDVNEEMRDLLHGLIIARRAEFALEAKVKGGDK